MRSAFLLVLIALLAWTPSFAEQLPPVNVKAFGAAGDGVADDTAAIQRAIDNAYSQRRSYKSWNGLGTEPAIYFPTGVYLTSRAISGSSYTRLVGDSAIIRSTSTTEAIFDLNGYFNRVSGLIFEGGRNHIRFVGPNVDGMFSVIEDCSFGRAAECVIDLDSARNNPERTGFSMHLVVDRFKSVNARFLKGAADGITITNGWATFDASAADSYWIDTGNTLRVANIVGSATHSAAVPGAWFHLKAGKRISIDNFRAGGERACTFMVIDHDEAMVADGSRVNVVVTNSVIDGVAGGYWLKIRKSMPESLVVRDCRSFGGTWGVWVDSATIPLDRILGYGRNQMNWDIGRNADATPDYKRVTWSANPSANVGTDLGDLLWRHIPDPEATLPGQPDRNWFPAGLISYASPGWSSVSSTGMSATTPDETTGYALGTYQATAATNSISTRINLGKGIPAGIYTLSAYVKSSGAGRLLTTYRGASNLDAWRFTGGDRYQRLSTSFYHDGGDASLGFNVYNLAVGQTVSVGLFQLDSGPAAKPYLYPGNPQGQRIVSTYYLDRVPTTGSYVVGDRVVRTPPVVGQPKAWVCTVKGSPGTWVSEGNL